MFLLNQIKPGVKYPASLRDLFDEIASHDRMLRFYLQVSAQGRTQLSHAAFIMTLEPVWTAILALVWLGERMRPQQVVGSALILCALVISRWRSIVR